MFIANGEEVINLNSVRTVQFFSNEKLMIRMYINESHSALFRFKTNEEFMEAQEEIVSMLRNISESWVFINHDVMVRVDKLQYANVFGSKLKMFFDTGMIHIAHEKVFLLMRTLAHRAKSISFGN